MTRSFHSLVRSALGFEADVQFPILDDIRANHGMTVVFDTDDGSSFFLVGLLDRFIDSLALSDTTEVHYFPPD